MFGIQRKQRKQNHLVYITSKYLISSITSPSRVSNLKSNGPSAESSVMKVAGETTIDSYGELTAGNQGLGNNFAVWGFSKVPIIFRGVKQSLGLIRRINTEHKTVVCPEITPDILGKSNRKTEGEIFTLP